MGYCNNNNNHNNNDNKVDICTVQNEVFICSGAGKSIQSESKTGTELRLQLWGMSDSDLTFKKCQ